MYVCMYVCVCMCMCMCVYVLFVWCRGFVQYRANKYLYFRMRLPDNTQGLRLDFKVTSGSLLAHFFEFLYLVIRLSDCNDLKKKNNDSAERPRSSICSHRLVPPPSPPPRTRLGHAHECLPLARSRAKPTRHSRHLRVHLGRRGAYPFQHCGGGEGVCADFFFVGCNTT